MREKYLPIGSVILLKGGTKKVMIIGFGVVADNNQSKVWDYCSILYPEGYLAENKVLMFDHDQIEKIYFLGYEEEEEIAFKKELDKVMDEFKEMIEKGDSTNTPNNIGIDIAPKNDDIENLEL